MKFNWVLFLRVQQLLFSLTILGLSAYVVSWYTMETRTASPTQVNFLVAVPILSLISLFYSEGSQRVVPALYSPYVAVGVDAINAILYFGGFIALAVFLNSLLFCRGMVCGSARAATAFSAFSFASWTASAVLLALNVFRAGVRKPNPRTQAMYAAEMKDATGRA
ncbi:MARVEL-like domain protein [Niveomyces insectorum RCEF 264]|uniref:MARVEL-like domain protein n=1 Tax=Niveomyces insectorum RCEF 264 TaxID=1081102 RepID=A0A167ZSG8_9HYPO|nr:MARVEL-like domain protein [Niveomyces insectorum RCEF 264]